MVLIKEYRIPLPLTVEEYRIAQLYMVAKFSRQNTSEGEGVEILVNEPYEDEKGKGQFTHKKIHLGSHLPTWAKAVLPAGYFYAEEKAWNAYPYVKAVYTCPLLGERFSIVQETKYVDSDDGAQENIHNLSGEILKQREVDFIDIVTESVAPKYYKSEEDPTLFKSEKTGRGPLQAGWRETTKPRMCVYKLATVEFKYWGFQTKGESWIHQSMVRDVLTLGHKQAYTWIDEWVGQNLEQIRKYEEDTRLMLDLIRKGEKIENVLTWHAPEKTEEKQKTSEIQVEAQVEPQVEPQVGPQVEPVLA